MKSADFTYERADLTIWTLAEPAASIMAISIPVLRMLYTELRTTRKGYVREGTGKYASRSQTSRSKSSSAWHEPSSRYGRHEAVIVSTTDWQDSQEALQSHQNEGGVSQNARGITKTDQVSVRHEQASSEERRSIELENFGDPRV
ncbi:hypothetical protein NW762_011946 [Fusarium torreyae]|uniref:Integral membrane protein n=1 Tax=Fusarium torreyae TaxID=1237075 RepID=A0A9W8V8S3_9HYPO|nr:hypothetical protein NW762_011946 [Fusarium torreyae]